VLTEAQVVALEKAKEDKEAHGEFESECPGYCAGQDTFYVGTLKYFTNASCGLFGSATATRR
jgi:hypothetical protein